MLCVIWVWQCVPMCFLVCHVICAIWLVLRIVCHMSSLWGWAAITVFDTVCQREGVHCVSLGLVFGGVVCHVKPYAVCYWPYEQSVCAIQAVCVCHMSSVVLGSRFPGGCAEKLGEHHPAAQVLLLPLLAQPLSPLLALLASRGKLIKLLYYHWSVTTPRPFILSYYIFS